MDQGSGDGADDDSYQHNGGDDENHETLASLALECLLFHRVYLAIALEGMDGIHENSIAVSVSRGGDVNQRHCNRDIQFNIWFLGALESSLTFSLLSIFFFSFFSFLFLSSVFPSFYLLLSPPTLFHSCGSHLFFFFVSFPTHSFFLFLFAFSSSSTAYPQKSFPLPMFYALKHGSVGVGDTMSPTIFFFFDFFYSIFF